MSADLRTIATFSDPIEAELVADRLDEEGIAAVISGDMTSNTFSGLGYMAGGIDVLVPAAELDRARTILANFAKEIEAKKHPPSHAITAAPPILELQETPTPTAGPDAPPTSEEDLIDRAFKASLFGFMICTPALPVLHIYSLLVLLYVAFLGRETRPQSSTKFYTAMILSGLSVAIGAAVTLNFIVESWLSWVFAAWVTSAIAIAMFVFTILYPRHRK